MHIARLFPLRNTGGHGANLKAFPELHTEPSIQGKSFTGTSDLKIQLLTKHCLQYMISYSDPGVTPRKPGLKVTSY